MSSQNVRIDIAEARVSPYRAPKLRCVTKQFLEIRAVEIGSRETRKVSGRRIIGHGPSESYHQVTNKMVSVRLIIKETDDHKKKSTKLPTYLNQ